MSKQVKTVGMLLALSALPMGAVYAGNVTSPTAVQNRQRENVRVLCLTQLVSRLSVHLLL